MIMVFIKRTFGDIRGVVGNSSGQIRFLSFFGIKAFSVLGVYQTNAQL